LGFFGAVHLLFSGFLLLLFAPPPPSYILLFL
jgi:hypothetical protein